MNTIMCVFGLTMYSKNKGTTVIFTIINSFRKKQQSTCDSVVNDIACFKKMLSEMVEIMDKVC
jgi:hypothetical protein